MNFNKNCKLYFLLSFLTDKNIMITGKNNNILYTLPLAAIIPVLIKPAKKKLFKELRFSEDNLKSYNNIRIHKSNNKKRKKINFSEEDFENQYENNDNSNNNNNDVLYDKSNSKKINFSKKNPENQYENNDNDGKLKVNIDKKPIPTPIFPKNHKFNKSLDKLKKEDSEKLKKVESEGKVEGGVEAKELNDVFNSNDFKNIKNQTNQKL